MRPASPPTSATSCARRSPRCRPRSRCSTGGAPTCPSARRRPSTSSSARCSGSTRWCSTSWRSPASTPAASRCTSSRRCSATSCRGWRPATATRTCRSRWPGSGGTGRCPSTSAAWNGRWPTCSRTPRSTPAGPVRIGVEGSGDRVRIVVEDAGPGVPQAEKDPHLRALRPRVGGPPPRRHGPRPGPGRRARPPPWRRGVDGGPAGRRLPVHHRAPGRSGMTPVTPSLGRSPCSAVGLVTAGRVAGRLRHADRRRLPPDRRRHDLPFGLADTTTTSTTTTTLPPADHHDHHPADDDDRPDQRAGAGVLRRRQRRCGPSSAQAPAPGDAARACSRCCRPARRSPTRGLRTSIPAGALQAVTVTGGKATVDLAPGSLDQPGQEQLLRVRRRSWRPSPGCPASARSSSGSPAPTALRRGHPGAARDRRAAATVVSPRRLRQPAPRAASDAAQADPRQRLTAARNGRVRLAGGGECLDRAARWRRARARRRR